MLEETEFTFENFCNYVRGRMSNVTCLNNKYIILTDTQPLQNLVPTTCTTEVETLEYIYKNKLFEEVEYLLKIKDANVIQEGNTKYSEITKMEGKTCYRMYDNKTIKELNKANIKFAAFDKGNGKYNIAFKENVLDKVNKIANETKVKNLGKEAER